MRRVDYQRLEAAVYADCRAALEAFSFSLDNIGVYAVALQFDPERGDPVLALNTERAYDERVLPRYPDAQDLRRIGGPRWNPAEFGHFDIAPAGAASRRLTARYQDVLEAASDVTAQAHGHLLAEALVRVVERLTPAFQVLDRRPDFIAYVWPIEFVESELIDLTRRTVPAPLFDRLFPEVRATEVFMESLSDRPCTGQAAFWASALRDLVLETDSEASRMLQALGRTQFDATDALVRLGPVAIPELVSLAEEHGMAEEWNERDSAEWKRRGARTRHGELAASALLALHHFDDGPGSVVPRLQTLLEQVYERDRGRPLAGINGQLIARALHALRPSQFPPARFSETTNHLLNFKNFKGASKP